MSDPHVRTIGQVLDVLDVPLKVGVDYDTVVIGDRRLDCWESEDFARLFVTACWQAAQQRSEMPAVLQAEPSPERNASHG